MNDSLIDEGESAFPISLIAREDNKDSEAIKKLAEHLSGPEVREIFRRKLLRHRIPGILSNY